MLEGLSTPHVTKHQKAAFEMSSVRIEIGFDQNHPFEAPMFWTDTFENRVELGILCDSIMYATEYGLADDYHVQSIWALVLLLFGGVKINYAGDEILWIRGMKQLLDVNQVEKVKNIVRVVLFTYYRVRKCIKFSITMFSNLPAMIFHSTLPDACCEVITITLL